MARRDGKPDSDAPDFITIKKYANRRLYNTAESTYVTLEDLATMVQAGIDFKVNDAKTGEDITRAVLTQIIVEQEAKGNNLLPTGFLRQLIGFYGDNLQGLVPQYLDMTMQSFTRNQGQMRSYLENTLGGLYPFSSFEEMGRQNMAMFENAIKMMTPFKPPEEGDAGPQDAGKHTVRPPSGTPEAPADETLSTMKSQLEAMQKQLDKLAKQKD